MKENKTKGNILICTNLILIFALVVCLVFLFDGKTSATGTNETVKTLGEYFFADSDSKLSESITVSSGEKIVYSDYTIQIDSYIYDSNNDIGYVLLAVQYDGEKTKDFDIEQEFNLTFSFKYLVDGNYFTAPSPRVVLDGDTLYLYYRLKEIGNKITIWNEIKDEKAAEFMVDETCMQCSEFQSADGRNIWVTPIGMEIVTLNNTEEGSDGNTDILFDEDLKEMLEDGIETIDIVYKNGDRVTVLGNDVESSGSRNLFDGNIIRIVRFTKIIDVENIDSIEINGQS